MKRAICLAALAIVASGCVASSHLTLGPANVQSSAATHEWRDANFYAEDGKVGSTLGFFSSEVAVDWRECEELSTGLSLSWNQDRVAAYPDAVCPEGCTGCETCIVPPAE